LISNYHRQAYVDIKLSQTGICWYQIFYLRQLI